MKRLTSPLGSTVVVSDEKADRLARQGYVLLEDQPAGDNKGYADLKVDELKAEIATRNEGRDEADLLSSEGKKADLIAVLEADDNK